MVAIGVLGAIRMVAADGSALPLRSERQRLLLAVLVSRSPQVVDPHELVEALWGGGLPSHPMAALQSQVFRLRRQVEAAGGHVDFDGSGYRLHCAREMVDAPRFEDLLARAVDRPGEPSVALRALDEGLALWRGRAYLEVAEHDSIRVEAARLEERRAEAAELRAELLTTLGNAAEAARAMEALADEHPLRERPIAIRMRALAAGGRHVDALRAFQDFRRGLGEEVGLEPSTELRTLESEILRHELPTVPRVGVPGNSFIAREAELAEVCARLAEGRLVTVAGPGGVGKSRLARHAAARLEPRYPGGVCLCSLADITTAEAVVSVATTALRLERVGGKPQIERLVQFLASRAMLLVLDNCEHVLGGARELVAAVLAQAPDVDVLATSRHRLGVEGEHVLPLGPLRLPAGHEPDAPAVALFVDRATAVRPNFRLTTENILPVIELCRLVDGLPLALELAAARTAARTPAEILSDVAHRSDQLHDGSRSTDRHRSMNTVLTWSYERLEAGTQHVLDHAATFSGGFTLDAVAAAADVEPGRAADHLTALVEHSLVTATDAGGTTRYSLLEPIRQFADARLDARGERTASRARHAAWARAWIERADAGLRGPDEAAWVAAVAAERANLWAAVRWAIAHDRQTAEHIVGAMYWYAYWYGAPEVFDWAAVVLGDGDRAAGRTLGAAYAPAVLAAARHGSLARARAWAELGREAAIRAPVEARFVWQALSSAEVMAGNYERALECQQQALELARRAGDRTHEAREHGARALVLGYLGRLDAAEDELGIARHLGASSGNPTIQAFCEYVAGEILAERAPGEAIPMLERARDAGRLVGNRYLAAIAGLSAMTCVARRGERADTLDGYAEVLDYFHRSGSRAQQWTAVRALVESLTRLGRDEPAAVLHAALRASPSALPVLGADAVRMDAAMAVVKERVGAERFDQFVARGARLDDDEAVSYALQLAAGSDVGGS